MKFSLNMASRRYINQRLVNRIYLGVILLLSLVFLGITVNGVRLAWYTGKFQQHLIELKGADQQGTEQEKPLTAEELERLNKKLQFVRKIQEQDQFRWTVLLNRLEKLAIEGVRVQTIKPDYSNGALNLTALARDDQLFRDFLDSLLTSGEFSDVFLLEQELIQVEDGNNRQRRAVSFQVVLKGAF